jgi:hypothetical protein
MSPGYEIGERIPSKRGGKMAQTKTPQRRDASQGSSRSRSQASKGRSGSRSPSGRSGGQSRSSAQKKPSARAGGRTQSRGRSANGQTTVEGVTGAVSSRAQTVSSRAQNAAQGIAGFVKKAKAPLIAGGAVVAGIAGLAGAAALNNARSRRRKVLGVTMPKGKDLKKLDAQKLAGAVTDGAKRADRFGQRVSSVANTVQTVSETADKATKRA